MSKIKKVTANDDYTLLIEFEGGNKVLFNMQELVKTIPYSRLRNLECFKNIIIEDKAISWRDQENKELSIYPVRLTIDNILFNIRD
jgi:hypothetical protein